MFLSNFCISFAHGGGGGTTEEKDAQTFIEQQSGRNPGV